MLGDGTKGDFAEHFAEFGQRGRRIAERLMQARAVLDRDPALRASVEAENRAALFIHVIGQVGDVAHAMIERLWPVMYGAQRLMAADPKEAMSERICLLAAIHYDHCDAAKLIDEFHQWEWHGDINREESGRFLHLCRIVASYCRQTEDYWLAGNLIQATLSAGEAKYWFGFLSGRDLGRAEGSEEQTRKVQQRLLNARHRENRAAQAEAIKFYEENAANFKSDTKIAMHISEKIVPAAFMTVRNWISEHKREKRKKSVH